MSKNIIIIPTYNEVGNISVLIKKIFSLLKDADIMVVDDSSPDGTAREVETLQKQYPNLLLIKRKFKDGLGRAYIESFKSVLKNHNYKTIIMMDADMSHDPKYLPEILRLSETYDLVIGSRYVPLGNITKKWGVIRRILSAGGNIYLRILFRKSVCDWTTGYNAISIKALANVDFELLNPKGYAFIFSLKYYLLKQKATFIETPIFFEERSEGKSKMSWHIILEGLVAPWKVIIREFFR